MKSKQFVVIVWGVCERCGQSILTPQAGKLIWRTPRKYSGKLWSKVHRNCKD